MTLAPLLESILPIYEERARKRQLETLRQFNDEATDVPPLGHNGENGKTRDLLAKKMKVGKNKIQKLNLG